MASTEGGRGGGGDFRLPCSVCCRKFSSDVLKKHELICEKTAQKKRSTFDSAKQRILGTDIPITKPTRKNKSPQRKGTTKPRLDPSLSSKGGGRSRNQLTSFQKNRLNAGLVQCPTCERHFSDKAADRHIPWCKDLKQRIPRSPPCNVAKDRLTARIQYRAPLPGKRRSSSPPRRIQLNKTWSNETISPSSSVKVTGTAIQAQRRDRSNGNGMVHSTSWEYVAPKKNYDKEQSMMAVVKKSVKDKSEMDLTSYDPFESAQRQMEELMSGTSVSPELAPKLIQPGSRTSTNQVRENKIRSNQSSWSIESDKELEDIEEDLVFDDNDIEIVAIPLHFPPPHPQMKGSRHPRRTVSREEALFGSKHSTGSLDSDYESLMRRSPSTPAGLRHGQQHNLNEMVDRNHLCSSRSSSETSLPPLGDVPLVKMSRFCHECGAPFPIKNAKFCCECGIRRLCIT